MPANGNHLAKEGYAIEWKITSITFKATVGGLEAHLHQAYRNCAIGAMSSQTHGNVLWWFPKKNQGDHPIHLHRFVMELLQ